MKNIGRLEGYQKIMFNESAKQLYLREISELDKENQQENC